jgi:hypothetical protein
MTKLQIARKVRSNLDKQYPNSGGLEGLCTLASCALAKGFRKHGYWCLIKVGADHAWVEENDIIWDLTLTQFSKYPRVYHSKERIGRYHEEVEPFRSYKTFKDWFCQPSWRLIKPLLEGV